MAATMRASSLCTFCRHLRGNILMSWHPLQSSAPLVLEQQVRFATNKHWDPKWRRERGRKFLKIDLPDFEKLRRESNVPPEELRNQMKEKRMSPPRTFEERNLLISATNVVFEPYVPPEGDGVASVVSKDGAKQRLTEIEKKGKSYMQLRKIRQFEDDFNTKSFAEQAQEIYIEAHKLLENIKDNEDRLHELTTEKAYPEMTWKLEYTTFRWSFLESLEPPRVVHVRTTDLLSKDNVYGQVTVRMHTKQTLAIYDRFGRLMYGSEHLAKDCLEYVVFEKHLSDEYGRWRIHGKIVPDWMPPQQPMLRTMRKPKMEPIEDDEDKSSESTEKSSEEYAGGLAAA